MEWLDDVREDIRRTKINWKIVVGDREDWKKIVELAMTLIPIIRVVELSN